MFYIKIVFEKESLVLYNAIEYDANFLLETAFYLTIRKQCEKKEILVMFVQCRLCKRRKPVYLLGMFFF